MEAEEGYSLLMASQSLPSPIGTGRRAGGTCPDGACGECRVVIEDGTGLSPRTELELRVLEAHAAGAPHEGRERTPGPPLEANERLGCHARVKGSGAVVRVKALVDFAAVRGDPTGS